MTSTGPAALFDVEGTLLDATYPHTLARWEALRQYGRTVPAARVHRAVAMGADRLLDHLLGEHRDRDDDERHGRPRRPLRAVRARRAAAAAAGRRRTAAPLRPCARRGRRVRA
ncbi:hypothetical protein [Kitasatospora purpeofusca]|uniref:hypothetical protein n=1 Tax=Kitasatospora purpeofusca TaxID=67352 RepID=UPI0036D3015C